MPLCSCFVPNPVKERVGYLFDEIKELVEEPSAEEAWDVIWSLWRLVEPRAILWPVMQHTPPGRKFMARVEHHGCMRSEAHRDVWCSR